LEQRISWESVIPVPFVVEMLRQRAPAVAGVAVPCLNVQTITVPAPAFSARSFPQLEQRISWESVIPVPFVVEMLRQRAPAVAGVAVPCLKVGRR